MINWGIIGLGTIANTFASDLKFVDDANLKAVASRDLKKAKKFKDKHQVQIAYGNYVDLAKDLSVDIVYIATPHVFHFENAKLCLEHGKAVLCEKPMGMNADETAELCAIAKKNNTLLMEGLWTVFLPNFQRLQEIVRSKKLGKIKTIHADFCFKAPDDPKHRLINKSLGGGSILDIGIYTVFIALEFLGIPQKVEALADINTSGIDLSCDTTFIYNNAVAKLKSSLKEDTPIEVNIEFEKGHTVLGPNFFSPSDLRVKTVSDEKIYYKHSIGSGYQIEALHFQDLFKQKQLESPIWPHEKSIQLASYLDVILKKIGVSYELD